MTQRSEFVICNDQSKILVLNIEPEAVRFALLKGEEVKVTHVFETSPVTIKLTASERSELFLSIWPGDGDVMVLKDGINVLDLIQRGDKAPI
jgi:hypothetical protein